MNKHLFANPDLCTGCNRCAYVCSAVKEQAFIPSLSRIRISNFAMQGYSVPNICFQCPKADCLEACPEQALYRNEHGVVLVAEDKCNGCRECLEACPYGAIELNPSGIAYKCDTCGGDPVCVRECYPGALIFEEANGDLARLRAAQLKNRTSHGTPRDRRQRLADQLLRIARE